MKKISFFLFLILTLGLLTGCAAMSYQTGHSSVQNMRSTDKYVVGQTTLNEVQEELGATMYIFEKKMVLKNTFGNQKLLKIALIPLPLSQLLAW